MAQLELQAFTRLQEIREQTEAQLRVAMMERKVRHPIRIRNSLPGNLRDVPFIDFGLECLLVCTELFNPEAARQTGCGMFGVSAGNVWHEE